PAKTETGESFKNMETPLLFTEKSETETAPAALEQTPGLEEQIGVLSVGVFKPAEEAPAAPMAEEPKEGFFSRLMNLFRFKKTAPAPAPAEPVQAEWSLDKVKVVRNDLSDTDLDVVFASVEAEPQVKKAPAKKQHLVSSAWRRVDPAPEKSEQ